jgi:hypothetical protein
VTIDAGVLFPNVLAAPDAIGKLSARSARRSDVVVRLRRQTDENNEEKN